MLLLLVCTLTACNGSERSKPPAAPAPIGAAPLAGFATGYQLLYESADELNRDLSLIAATGAKWLRFDVAWAEVEKVQGAYDWEMVDRVVGAAKQRGLRLLATLAYTPEWARPPGTDDKTAPTTDEQRAAYGVFAQSATARYLLDIDAWELWNEQNIVQFWAPKPDARSYVALAHQASVGIRSVDPDAVILLGGLAPAQDGATSSSPMTYLRAVYDAGIAPDITAVAIHPYAFPRGPLASSNLFQQLPELHDVMREHGDEAKQIWATEYGAPTGGPSDQRVTEAQQAQFVVDAFNQAAEWPWMGPLFWYSHRDKGTNPGDREDHFGLWRVDFSTKPAYDVFTIEMQLPTTTTGS